MQEMQPLKAHVKNGQIVVDEPAELAEGQVFYLVPVDEAFDDQLDDAELQRSLETSVEQWKAGKTVDGEALLAKLRTRS